MSLTRREWLAGAAALPLAGADRKPNFVFICTDDHHYQAFGAAGNPHIRTPNMDRLAARGTLFRNAIASTPQCCPNRGVLLSGRETYQTGLRSNGAMRFDSSEGPSTISQLRKAGYDTTLVGKWHIKHNPSELGFNRAPLWLEGGGSRYQNPRLRSGFAGEAKEVSGHITELFTDEAISQIGGSKQPFFLWLAYNAPHEPLYADAQFQQMYAGKTDLAPPAHPRSAKPYKWDAYYAAITQLDENIGRVMDTLEQRGLWDNTVVVLVGDNGYLCGTKGLNGKVHPWEESLRVPLVIAGAGVRKQVTDAPAASIDLPATWLEIAGVKPETKITGRSLRGLITTGRGGPEANFGVWDDGRPEALVIKVPVEPYRAVRTRKHKLIVWESKKQSLFDIAADPGEERDLIGDAKFGSVVRDLREKLSARCRETNDRAAAWLNS